MLNLQQMCKVTRTLCLQQEICGRRTKVIFIKRVCSTDHSDLPVASQNVQLNRHGPQRKGAIRCPRNSRIATVIP